MAKSKKNAAAVALGRLGGLRGGKARAARMTALEHPREKTHALKQAMMQKILTGKTRLV